MSCCECMTTQKEHDQLHAGQCEECECDVDKDGECVEMDDCSYSPDPCGTCGYRPCDQSC